MNIRNVFLNKKVLVSLSIVAVVSAIVIGGTMAYFSDTETSTGNKFTAGKFNLLVGSECSYNGETQLPCNWLKKDLANELFFNFDDIKPGDSGENTVTLRADNNDAWICAELANLVSDDNGCDSPENKLDTNCGAGEGELQDNLFFTIWKDADCDNVLDMEVQGTPAYCGGGNSGNVQFCASLGDSSMACANFAPDRGCIWYPETQTTPAEQVLVDNQPATSNFWPIADSQHGPAITGDTDYCLGISWNVPIGTSNVIQSDSLMGDVKFTAVQARNIDNFKCSDLYTEVCFDGIDNNYDGQVDEDCGCASNQECNDGIYCNGVETCNAEHECVSPGDPCPGPDGDSDCSESCNEASDDCTANDADGTSCTGGLCQNGTCNPSCIPTSEVCNGIDDDCDGQTDESDVCWISPTSYLDYGYQGGPLGYWILETDIYDRNTASYAIEYVLPGWGPFLELNLTSPITSNKLRYWLPYSVVPHSISQIDIDVYKDGIWTDVYQGTNTPKTTWIEVAFSSGQVSKARVRLYNSAASGLYSNGLSELQIWNN